MQKRTVRIAVGAVAVAALSGFAYAVWAGVIPVPFEGKFAAGDPDTVGDADQIGGFYAYLAAARTYPADSVPVSVAINAIATFDRIAAADAQRGDPGAKGRNWSFFGPQQAGIQPGVTAFSGAVWVRMSARSMKYNERSKIRALDRRGPWKREVELTGRFN